MYPNTPTSSNSQNTRLKKWLLFGIPAVVLLGIVIMISRSSSIKITSSGGTQGSYAYSITSQADGKVIDASNTSGKLTKSVKPGIYEVVVRQNNRSYFQVVTAGGWLRAGRVSAKLEAESSRRFVGDNPGSCMFLLDSLLVSRDCGDAYDLVNTHVPATPDMPTYLDTATPYGKIEGSATTKEGSIALYAAGESDEEGPGIGHIAHLYRVVNGNIQPISQMALSDLDRLQQYNIEAYLDGFIAYTSDYSQILYYPAMAAKPSTIALDKPKNPRVYPLSLSTSSTGEIAVSYASSPDSGDGEDASSEPTTEVVVYKNKQSSHVVYGTEYAFAGLCGESTLCLMNSETRNVEIDQINGSNHQNRFMLRNVTSIFTDNQQVLAITTSGVLRLNTATKSGSYDYSFGKYSFCGIQAAKSGYLLCLRNPNDAKVALHIDTTSKDTEGIDRKISGLIAKTADVANVSIVGQIIYVIPTGENIYDSINRTYGPDPTKQKQVNDRITAHVRELGIDASRYQVFITAPQD